MNKWKSIKGILDKFNYILNKNQKKYAVLILFLTLIGAVFETLGVSVIIPFVSVLLNPEDIKKNKLVINVSDILNIQTTQQLILFIGIVIMLIYLVKNLYLSFLSYMRVHFATKVQLELSVLLMQSYMKRGYSYFTTVNTSELLQGTGNDISSVYQMLYNVLRIISEFLTAAAICMFVVATDVKMALSIIALLFSCFFLIFIIFKKPMSNLGKEFRETNKEVSQFSLQAFQGIKEIIVMHKQKFFTDAYEKAGNRRQRAIIWQTVANEVPAYAIEAVCVVGLLAVVIFRAIDGTNTKEFIPQLAAFAVAAFRILPSLGRISSGFNQFIYYSVSLDSVYNNLKEVDAYEKKLTSIINSQPDDLKKDQDGNNEYLSLCNVSWKYENSLKNVIDHLDLKIREGQSVAFIGQSGAGKTTLADIILGLYDPQEGSVRYKGADIRSMSEAWRQTIGYIPQTLYLLDDTIKNNIAFGITDNEIDEELVWNALEQAQLKEFVKSLPDKLETLVGERGVRFSGGQRQRIAIARALYYNPDILVLDEATSALDTETEKAVMEAIDTLQGKKTLIIVAHRLSTIKNCDVIYEIVNGKAVIRDKLII